LESAQSLFRAPGIWSQTPEALKLAQI
jgi:hypothetical protein